MKKILFALSLLVATMTQAQVKQYDVNNNQEANIGDITSVIDAAWKKKQVDANYDATNDIQNVKTIAHYLTHNVGGYEFVDLGLPSGTLWATCNVGAELPEEYGDYFAWGEVEKKEDYSWNTYKFTTDGSKTFTKYNTDSSRGNVDDKVTLEPEDDAAAYHWGNDWQMPTSQDITELRNYCTRTVTTINGVEGCLVKSENGNSIFLPFGGYYDGTTKNSDHTGCYWSSSLNLSGVWTAHSMVFDNSNFSHCNVRRSGRNVRPVRKQP